MSFISAPGFLDRAGVRNTPAWMHTANGQANKIHSGGISPQNSWETEASLAQAGVEFQDKPCRNPMRKRGNFGVEPVAKWKQCAMADGKTLVVESSE